MASINSFMTETLSQLLSYRKTASFMKELSVIHYMNTIKLIYQILGYIWLEWKKYFLEVFRKIIYVLCKFGEDSSRKYWVL